MYPHLLSYATIFAVTPYGSLNPLVTLSANSCLMWELWEINIAHNLLALTGLHEAIVC